MPDSRDDDMHSQIQSAHAELDGFFESTREALAGPEARMACRQLREALETHFAQEESLYFPTLRKLRPDVEKSLGRIIASHAGFLEKLDVIAGFIDAGAKADALADFEALQRQFALHEAGEKETLRSIT